MKSYQMNNDLEVNLLEEIRDLLNKFSLFTNEICLEDLNFSIIVVDSIKDYLCEVDLEYAREHLMSYKTLYGIVYVNTENYMQIILEKTDEVNFLGSLYHELVHVYDYSELAKYKDNNCYRELQEDWYFLMWTEFHATYLSYKYLSDFAYKNIDCYAAVNDIKKSLLEYYNAPRLELSEMVNTTIRSYGSYIGVYDLFKDKLNKYMQGFFFNKEFLDIYDFLYNHKSFADFICDYEVWVELLNQLEKK